MSSMKVGFTGTRNGMTDVQRAAFREWLTATQPIEFHHGDCVGADEQAANDAARLLCDIHCHPPLKDDHQARTQNYDHLHQPKTHFARNRDIVDACDVLAAAPLDLMHQTRGGTWYTVDYALKRGKPVVVFWPDGRVEKDYTRKKP